MILRLSQKLSTKIKAGTLKAMQLDEKSVCGLVVASVHGIPDTVLPRLLTRAPESPRSTEFGPTRRHSLHSILRLQSSLKVIVPHCDDLFCDLGTIKEPGSSLHRVVMRSGIDQTTDSRSDDHRDCGPLRRSGSTGVMTPDATVF